MDRDSESYMAWCEERTARIWAIRDVKWKEKLILLGIFLEQQRSKCMVSNPTRRPLTFETLAEGCRLSPPTVKKYCLSLVSKGYLKLVNRQGMKHPRFVLCLPKGKRSESDTNWSGLENG